MANLILDHGVSRYFGTRLAPSAKNSAKLPRKTKSRESRKRHPPGFFEIDVCAQCALKGEIR